ncbi:MAG: glutamate synthase domain-containing protein 2, partial [Candidatus Azotimanducaceae bacterium]
MSKTIYAILAGVTAAILFAGLVWGWIWWLLIPVVTAWMLSIQDSLQQQHSLRRNFPLLGRARWLAELIRPFVRQYFIESDTDGAPINRMFRSIVYQRAKGDLDTTPYGTKVDVYRDGYEWLSHSLGAHTVKPTDLDNRVEIGGPDCKQKYSASLLNISAMSYGSL